MEERQENINKARHFITKTQSKIKEILTHIQTMEPNHLLPQDSLYVGKLARVNKSEIYAHDGDKESGCNIYGQRLSLAFGEHEKKLWDSYNLQEEFYILITSQSKIEYKEFKYKKYTPRDTFKVWVINYDSLLESVCIAEKEPEPKHMDVLMLFDERLGSKVLEYAYIFNDSNLSYSVLDYQEKVLTLGVAHLMLKCRATSNHLVLQEIRELPKNFTEKLNDKIFPLERGITFVYTKDRMHYDELAMARSVSVEDMLIYIQTQMRLSQHQELEYDPFKKWQQIIEHQIQINSYTQVAYQSYVQNNHLYTFKTTDSILIDRTN